MTLEEFKQAERFMKATGGWSLIKHKFPKHGTRKKTEKRTGA
jgi:hypothetical protein